MLSVDQFPPRLLARAVALRIQGRIRFPKEPLGSIEHGEDEDFKVFRMVALKPSEDQPDSPGATFTVRFHFGRFTARTNRLLSSIPIPFIVAQHGFRSKTWILGQTTGAFQGVYEWDSIEDAEAYWTSFPMRLMKRRAIPGTLDQRIESASEGRRVHV